MKSIMRQVGQRLAAGRIARLLTGVVLVAAAAAPMSALAEGAESAVQGMNSSYQVEVSHSKSQVLEVPGVYTDLMVADPRIADVVPLTNHSVYVVGKTLGSTALTIYGPGKHLIAVVDVVVGPDIQEFKTRLHEILPDEKDISARAANQSLILSGTVSSPAALGQVLALGDTYDPGGVVNMLGVEGTQQVMLSVRFVEMERTAAKNLNFSVTASKTFGTGTTSTVTATTGSPLQNAFGTLGLTISGASGSLNVALDALETKGVVKTLAEPTLVAMSGDTASFLAGGEIPIPTATSSGIGTNIVITFQQFGISLAFTPTILRDGLINLVVKPEVSSLDASNGVTEAGLVIPGLKVRRANTTVELRDGESFTIAGLLSDNYSNSINQFPFLGNVPVLGALFRSPSFQDDKTELVIVVTPHLVTARRGPVALPGDHYTTPSDYELFLFGILGGRNGAANPEDRALMSRDPNKGGVEGPYGHVLY